MRSNILKFSGHVVSLRIFPRKLLTILLQMKHKDWISEKTRLMACRLNDNMILDEKQTYNQMNGRICFPWLCKKSVSSSGRLHSFYKEAEAKIIFNGDFISSEHSLMRTGATKETEEGEPRPEHRAYLQAAFRRRLLFFILCFWKVEWFTEVLASLLLRSYSRYWCYDYSLFCF